LTKYVLLELNPLELDVIHKGLELLLKERFIDSLLDRAQIMMISEDIRNASNQKLMESTILSSRIKWSMKDIPSLKNILLNKRGNTDE